MLIDRTILESMWRVCYNFLTLLEKALDKEPSVPSREDRVWLCDHFKRHNVNAIPDDCTWLIKIVRSK